MKRHRDKLRELARSRVIVRVTGRTRSAKGFWVVLNGVPQYGCNTHKEAVNHLRARLQCVPRQRWEVRPG